MKAHSGQTLLAVTELKSPIKTMLCAVCERKRQGVNRDAHSVPLNYGLLFFFLFFFYVADYNWVNFYTFKIRILVYIFFTPIFQNNVPVSPVLKSISAFLWDQLTKQLQSAGSGLTSPRSTKND